MTFRVLWYHRGVQAAITSDATLPRRLTGVAADPIEKQRERARLAREAQAMKRLQGRISKMDRDGAIKHVEHLLADKKTPVQYHAALISQLSELNMWKRTAADDPGRVSIGEMLVAWKREDAGAYAGLMNQHAQPDGCISSTDRSVGSAHMHPATSAQAQAAERIGGGEPPIESTTAEALDPLSPPTYPEKVSQSAESKGVSVKPVSNQPEDGWME